MIDFVTDRLENIEEKRENAGYQHFLLFLTMLLAHLSMECSVSYCDHSPSVVVCSKFSALELENLPYLTSFTLKHLQILTNQYQVWPQYECPYGLV